MKHWLTVCVLALSAVNAHAAPWVFEPPITVSEDSAGHTFFHLEAAGRKSIAVSAGWVGVVWEDNRDGRSRCYLALKPPGAKLFNSAIVISSKEEAFQPTLLGLEDGKFALAWEEAGKILLRVADAKSLGPVSVLTEQGAQVSLSGNHKQFIAAWAEQTKAAPQIYIARIVRDAKTQQLHVDRAHAVERGSVRGDQTFPSLYALSKAAVVVAWEDRREGHTRILASASRDGGHHFGPAQEVNETLWRGQQAGFGRGTGVMRVALSSDGHGGIAAVWADKREFLAGYDVYAAFASAKSLSFKTNEKVQDEFGNDIAQWHPAIAGSKGGGPVVVWDDDRDGTPDIWLAWRIAPQKWSENLAVPGASGPGVQSDPSVTLDDAGNLHLVWIDKPDLNSPSRLRYLRARYTSTTTRAD